jgi:ATP-binding cassette subfamily B multidrug efflux pump
VVVGVFESSLYLLIGWFVDLLARTSPDRIFAEHGLTLAVIGAAILIVRPLLLTRTNCSRARSSSRRRRT